MNHNHNMEEAYYGLNKPDSLGSFAGLKRQTKKRDSDIFDFLAKQNAYTLHRNIIRRFPRRKTYAKGIDDLWQIDLVDLSYLARHNDGYRYLLMCIDVFSKYGRIEPVKTKTGAEITKAFAKMIVERKCVFVQSDKGGEFLNATFQQFLSDNEIKHYTSENEEIKCAVVERWNRTMETKIFKYMTYKSTNRYIDVLQDLVTSYNSTYHTTLKMAPIEVNSNNEDEVRHRMYPSKPKRIKWKFEIGDTVRMSAARRPFDRGYRQKWSEEMFKIIRRHPTHPQTYSISDYAGEEIKGKYYVQELQKVKDTGVYRIEKVLRT